MDHAHPVRRLILVVALASASCSSGPPELRTCPEGSIVAVDSCVPIPNRPFPPIMVRDGGNNAVPDGGNVPDGGPDAGVQVGGLDGRWAVAAVAVQDFMWDATGVEGTLQTTFRFVVDINDDGNLIQASGVLCAYETQSAEGLQFVLPQAARDTFLLNWRGSSPDLTAPDFTLSPIVLFAGWSPETTPSQAQFIQSEDDPRVSDTDSDNRPGFTYEGSAGGTADTIYAAARHLFSLTGTLNPDGNEIRGSTGPLTEIFILGSEAGVTPGPITFLPTVNDAQRFVFQRADGPQGCDVASSLVP